MEIQGETPDDRCQRHITPSQLLGQNIWSRFQLVVAGQQARRYRMLGAEVSGKEKITRFRVKLDRMNHQLPD